MGSSKGLIDMALVLVMLLLAVAVPSARCLLVSEEVVAERYPPEKYCDIHVNHTLCHYQNNVSLRCGPPEDILERGLSDEERTLVARLHNERRAFVANGLELRGDPGPQPPAANMMQLEYDAELEAEAQAWADQCVRNHECPRCRTLPRFKVGQNLFWFGHFTGSWEKSVKGWYDEVADFNNTFVYPFYVIPGVLVGHYTQLIWSQTNRIGCGKLFSYPDRENSPFGQQFFICNYGLAGNLIKSEMYKVGEACSQCPAGTSCSSEFPGLCTGVPDEPLTVRPPKFDHDFGILPTVKPKVLDFVPSDTVTLPTIVVRPPSKPAEKDKCVHECGSDRGCSVRLLPGSASFSGSVQGSCFPPGFGGDCFGTPGRCTECKERCEGLVGKRLTFEIEEDGSSGEPLIESLEEEENKPPPAGNAGKIRPSVQLLPGGSTKSDRDTCRYTCKTDGGCSVRFSSPRIFSGSVLGSCFPPDFGGRCSGRPDKCFDCKERCGDQRGVMLTFTLNEDGSSGEPLVESLSDRSSGGGGGTSRRTCSYNCQPSGACTVRINAFGSLVDGSVLGSCFSPSFGGRCSGTPDGCQDCLGRCKELGEGEHEVPAE